MNRWRLALGAESRIAKESSYARHIRKLMASDISAVPYLDTCISACSSLIACGSIRNAFPTAVGGTPTSNRQMIIVSNHSGWSGSSSHTSGRYVIVGCHSLPLDMDIESEPVSII